jgi:glycosyltransferase involved in cell wall biosynthesis
MKKNVLIISYSYPPNNVAGAQRPYALAKYLDKEKYNVTIITCENPDLPLGKNENFDSNLVGVEIQFIKSKVGNLDSNLRQKNNNHLKKGNISVSVKSILFKIGQQLIFPDKAMFWYSNVKQFLKKNPQLIENTDVVFSTSPGVTNHQIALFLKKKKKQIHWIADFRDFNYLENWEEKKGIKALLHKNLEYKIIKEANVLTFVTNTMLQVYQKYYKVFATKMLSVYNGFEIEDMHPVRQSNNDKLVFFYAGTFYNGLRSPLPLLQLIEKAIDDKLIERTKIIIQIAGNIDEQTKSQMMAFKAYSCIDFLGNLPRIQVLDYMHKSSFLWLIVANIKSHYQTIPIKFFEYIAAKRPILNFAPKEAEVSHIIKNHQMGCNIDTLDFSIEESYPIFQELVVKFKKGEYDLGLQQDFCTFTWEKQLQKINELI